MSNTLIAPEYELFPNRYRWTVAECYRMAEEGRLVGRYEVLDGEVVSKMGQKPPHRIAIALLFEYLAVLFGIRYVQMEKPLTLPIGDSVFNEPEPDVAVTREPTTAYTDRHPGAEDAVLVAEVSDTTLRTDQIVKTRLYARADIPEYWILDLNSRSLHIYRNPVNGEYQTHIIHPEAESITPLTHPNHTIAVADLLPPVVTPNAP